MTASKQNISKDRYRMIPRVLVFAARGESVLFIKGAPSKKNWPNLYNGVGGHVEKGEDFLSATHREFKEETGLALLSPWLCALVTIGVSDDVGILMAVFKGDVEEGIPTPSDEGLLEFIPFDQFQSLPLVEDIPILLPKVMSMQKDSPVLHAHYSYIDDELIIKFNQD